MNKTKNRLPKIEKELRRLSIDKLKSLKLFVVNPVVSATKLSLATGSKYQSLGGRVSSLLRTKIIDKQLIKQKGKTPDRRAQLELNKGLISQSELKKILEEIGI